MALVLTQGAFAGAEPYLDGNQPAITRSLPNWAVTSGELLVVGLGSCSANAAQGDPYFDLTGGGLTWTRRAEARRTDGGQFKASAAIFTATATSTTTITDMVASTTTNADNIVYAYAKATGHDTTTPTGVTAALADDSTDGQKDITLSGTPTSTSIVWAVCFMVSDSTGTGKGIDHGSSLSWTEDFDYGLTGANSYGTWEGQRKTSPSSTTVRWDDLRSSTYTGGSTYSFAGAAVEILEAGGAAAAPALRGIVRSGLRAG